MSFNPMDVVRVDEPKTKETDALVGKYESIIESIYEKQTRGDYTWRGVLIAFLWDYEEMKKKKPSSTVCRGD